MVKAGKRSAKAKLFQTFRSHRTSGDGRLGRYWPGEDLIRTRLDGVYFVDREAGSPSLFC